MHSISISSSSQHRTSGPVFSFCVFVTPFSASEKSGSHYPQHLHVFDQPSSVCDRSSVPPLPPSPHRCPPQPRSDSEPPGTGLLPLSPSHLPQRIPSSAFGGSGTPHWDDSTIAITLPTTGHPFRPAQALTLRPGIPTYPANLACSPALAGLSWLPSPLPPVQKLGHLAGPSHPH